MTRALTLLFALFSAVCAAQTVEPRPQRLYIDSGVLLGNPRVLALGGAYTGVAEGPGALPSNLAALAHKSPRLNRNWDIGFGINWLDVPIGSPRDRDLDNDERQDDAESSRQFLFSLMLQYGRFGMGAFWRSSRQLYCRGDCSPSTALFAEKSHTALAAAVALGDDDFIAAFGLYAANASFSARPFDGAAKDEEWNYSDTGTSFDMLWRPHRRPYRVGISVKPQVVGPWRRAAGQSAQVQGRTVFGAVVSPASLSLGASWRHGEGAENYNRLSPAAFNAALEGLREGDVPPRRTPADAPMGDVLVTMQLDFIAPTDNAVNFLSFVNDEAPQTVGDRAYVVLRAGMEHDAIPHRLRLRGGTYVEPSVFHGVNPRPHLTGGAEVFLFNYFDDWAVTTSFDVAPRYYNFGLSVGFWR